MIEALARPIRPAARDRERALVFYGGWLLKRGPEDRTYLHVADPYRRQFELWCED